MKLEWLIKTVIVYLIIDNYMDNRGNSRANTCLNARLYGRVVFIRLKPIFLVSIAVIHNN